MRTFALALCLALAASAGPAVAQEKEPDLVTRLKALKDLKGPFTLIVHLPVKKGEEKTMRDLAEPCVAATRKEKGCLTYELHQDLEDPTKFVFFERWKSPQDLIDHLGAEHTKKLLDGAGKILAEPPTARFYQLTDGK